MVPLTTDPPHVAIGQTLPPGSAFFDPFKDKSVDRTVDATIKVFMRSSSAYCNNPKDWAGDLKELDHGENIRVATVDSWTPEDNKRYFNFEVAARSEFNMCVTFYTLNERR